MTSIMVYIIMNMITICLDKSQSKLYGNLLVQACQTGRINEQSKSQKWNFRIATLVDLLYYFLAKILVDIDLGAYGSLWSLCHGSSPSW
jgi:hypothetical protein